VRERFSIIRRRHPDLLGSLFIVATPIGNLEDMTPRAARTLAEVSLIACEDTRQTSKLLRHLGIEKPMLAFHEHNERRRAAGLVARLTRGESVALVSDAGTPLVSDPGYRLVDAALKAGIPVIPIPGSCAAIAALSASGLPTDAFYFGGFLPPKQAQRRHKLEALRQLEATLVFYEAPHRILETLDDIAVTLGDRDIAIARELTKLHEEFLRGKPAGLSRILRARPSLKGEFTLLIGKADAAHTAGELPVAGAVAELESHGMTRMEAIKAVSRRRGMPKGDVYRLLEREKS
jgi:16S rRNA (cytidine1402-2'-O)-methyltransferase